MNLQYIWGNPARKKRKKSKKKSSKKVRRKKASSKKKTRRKTRRKKSASKKKSSKRRKKVARRKKKKNPYKTRYRKKGAVGSKGGSKYKYSATQLLPSERQSLKSKHSSLQNSIAKLERELERGKKAGVTVSSTVKARLSKAKNMSKLLNKKLRTDQVTALKNKKLKAELQKLGFEYDGIVKEAAKSTGGKSMARRKKAKKKATKKKGRKKATRKKATRRKARKKGKKKATRKKARKKGKKKAAKKAGRRRRRRRKSAVSASVNVGKSTISGKIRGRKRLKKGQSMRKTVRKKRRKYSIGIRRTNPLFRSNPVEVMGYKATGYDLAEVGELAVGGLTYGAINGFLASKVASRVPGGAKLASMLGGTALPLVAGVLAHAMADKFMPGGKAKQALLFMADGLTAASVVGMGVHLSQGLLSQVGLSGVDYVPAMPGAQTDFGGVDFTPELGGVDFTAGASLPGHNQDVDFGEYEESAADFGVVPEGLN